MPLVVWSEPSEPWLALPPLPMDPIKRANDEVSCCRLTGDLLDTVLGEVGEVGWVVVCHREDSASVRGLVVSLDQWVSQVNTR